MLPPRLWSALFPYTTLFRSKLLVAAGLTLIALWLPLIAGWSSSVAVSDCSPAVVSVAVKAWTPLSLPLPVVKVWWLGGHASVLQPVSQPVSPLLLVVLS